MDAVIYLLRDAENPMHRAKNRLSHPHADYLLTMVRRPRNWQPTRIDDVPADSEILSQEPVASFQEAYDDLIRCNGLAVRRNLDTWAVIVHPGSDI